MTAWYTGHWGHVAYSVRPDLWPAGTYCWARQGAVLLADWACQNIQSRPDQDYVAPGAAEALILGAGQVTFGWPELHGPDILWIPRVASP